MSVQSTDLQRSGDDMAEPETARDHGATLETAAA